MADLSLRDVAYERLLALIVEGELRPGERLVEGSLGTRLGMSRSPVREALKLLEQDGFVTTSQFVGARVAVLGPEEAKEVFELRIVLEALAAKRAAEYSSAQDCQELQDILDEASAAIDGEDYADLARENLKFHAKVAELSRSSELQRVLNRLSFKIEWLFHDYVHARGRAACSEHTALLEAIRAHDGDLAEALARTHIMHSYRHYVDLIADAEAKEFFESAGADIR